MEPLRKIYFGKLLAIVKYLATDSYICENKNREMFICNKSGKFSAREYFHLYSMSQKQISSNQIKVVLKTAT